MAKNKRAKKTATLLLIIFTVLAVIGGIGLAGYFVLDRVVVPKYFGKYNINNLNDLVKMVKVMHGTPAESEFIKHPYSADDEASAIKKLKDAGVPIENGEIIFKDIAAGQYVITATDDVFITDHEMAAILGQMLKSEYLVSYFSKLEYFGTLDFESKEVVIVPSGETTIDEYGNKISDSAHVSLTIKLDTTNALSKMSAEMDVPLFLLIMIMPKHLYISCNYDIEILSDGTYAGKNATLGINGRTPEQSEILLNMLISFIFSKEDEMTIEKLADEFGNVVNSGLKILGEVEFCAKDVAGVVQNGILVKLNPHVNP